MTNLYIVGAGSCAVELYYWFKTSPKAMHDYTFCGFIDDFCNLKDIEQRLSLDKKDDSPWCIKVKDYIYKDGDKLLIAFGNPSLKEQYYETLNVPDSAYTTFVHDTALVYDNVKLGPGTMVGPFCTIEPNVVIKDHVLVNAYSFVAHDSYVGNFSSLSPRSTLLGQSRVHKKAFIGACSCINVKREIEADAFVGMNSSVIHTVKEGSVVYGVPARLYQKEE